MHRPRGFIPGIRLLLLALTLVPLPLCSQDRSGAILQGEPFAHWLPAERAVAGGQLQEDQLRPEEKAEVLSWFRPTAPKSLHPKAPAKSTCDQLLVTSAGTEAVEPEEALQQANLGVLGTVTGIQPGLFRGRIASIVTVQVDRWLKAPKGFASPATVYFLYEDGNLTVGDTTYCRRSARRDRLALGRGVLLASSAVLQENPLLLLPYDRQLFFETAEQGISAPGYPKALEDKSWTDFEAALKPGRRGETK